MVDEVRVARLLRGITNTVASLHREQSASDDRRADALWLPGIKYLMIASIEGCIDVAQHVCSAEKWGPPRDNGDVMRILGERGVVADSTAEAMRRAVGFRNVLVHDYVDVDDDIVMSRLADLADVDRFVAEMAAWLTSSPSA